MEENGYEEIYNDTEIELDWLIENVKKSVKKSIFNEKTTIDDHINISAVYLYDLIKSDSVHNEVILKLKVLEDGNLSIFVGGK